MQDHARTGGDQSVGVELLVTESGEVALISGRELVEVVHLAAEACARVTQRKESYMPVQRRK